MRVKYSGEYRLRGFADNSPGLVVVWCFECGSVVFSMTVHDRFHTELGVPPKYGERE